MRFTTKADPTEVVYEVSVIHLLTFHMVRLPLYVVQQLGNLAARVRTWGGAR